MQHKKGWGPGYRFFYCEDCQCEWKERSRDCTSTSISICPRCNETSSPLRNEKHYEWPTDKFGNIEANDETEIIR